MLVNVAYKRPIILLHFYTFMFSTNTYFTKCETHSTELKTNHYIYFL